VPISIEPYSGRNESVVKLAQFLNTIPESDLFGAYIHGSLATLEEIKYSDMDVLIILNDEVIQSPKRLKSLAIALKRAQKMVFEYDPLQHHGWFILTSGMLKTYPMDYFPSKLFAHTRTLLTERGCNFDISFDRASVDFERPFTQLAKHLLRSLSTPERVNNMFYLKSLLSEFMLLPAFYVQARDRTGVYKKDSFDLAKADFSISNWMIMDQVSQIRQDWSYKIDPFQRRLLSSSSSNIRKLARRIAPSIPVHIKHQLSPNFYSDVLNLVELMIQKRSNES